MRTTTSSAGPVRTVATGLGGVCVAVIVGHDGRLGWQIVRVAVVLGVTVIVVRMGMTRRRAGVWIALGFGLFAAVIGGSFLPHLVKDGATVVGIAATGALLGGVVTIVSCTVDLVRRRGTWGRVVGVAGVVVSTVLVAWVAVPAVAATNVPRPALGATPATRDLEFEAVTLRTRDRVELAAWYVPSVNGAGLVALHGAGSTRSDVLDHAAVLAAHGYGVLLVDARGHGESGGRAMDFGWHGDQDVEAATRYLARHVAPDRIGVIGMSMGGEEAIGASATNPRIRAVIAEGATGRAAADHAWLSDRFGLQGTLQEGIARVRDLLTDALTTASVPESLHDAVDRSRARYLLISAGDVEDEGHAAHHIASAAPRRVLRWNVPGAGHTDGLATRPRAWERRVVAFLEDTLAARPVADDPVLYRSFHSP